jgi:hypothetical protein
MTMEDPVHSRDQEEGGQEREDKWYRHISFSDLFMLIGLLLGLKATLGDQIFTEAGDLAKSGLKMGKTALRWVGVLLTSPLILWTLRLYFGFLPLLALLFWIIGFRTAAYALAMAQMTLLIFTTFALTIFIRHGKGSGLFYRLMIDVNIIEFCCLSFFNFFLLLPSGLLSTAQLLNLFGLLIAMIPLAIILQSRWPYGWGVIYLLTLAPLILTIAVPEGALRIWIGERSAYQGYAAVVTTEPIRIYTSKGSPTGELAPAGDTLFVDFHENRRVEDHLVAFRCFTDYVQGRDVYLPLIRDVNYRRILPQEYSFSPPGAAITARLDTVIEMRADQAPLAQDYPFVYELQTGETFTARLLKTLEPVQCEQGAGTPADSAALKRGTPEARERLAPELPLGAIIARLEPMNPAQPPTALQITEAGLSYNAQNVYHIRVAVNDYCFIPDSSNPGKYRDRYADNLGKVKLALSITR